MSHQFSSCHRSGTQGMIARHIRPRPMSTALSNGNDLFRKSTLYREFQAEREEIMKHKWIESEKVGYDIGFEQALTDWILKHRSKWRRARQAAQASQNAQNN